MADEAPAPRKVGLYGQRPSKCADTVRRKEFAEIGAMSVRDRMLLALELGRRSAYFQQLFARAREARRT